MPGILILLVFLSSCLPRSTLFQHVGENVATYPCHVLLNLLALWILDQSGFSTDLNKDIGYIKSNECIPHFHPKTWRLIQIKADYYTYLQESNNKIISCHTKCDYYLFTKNDGQRIKCVETADENLMRSHGFRPLITQLLFLAGRWPSQKKVDSSFIFLPFVW